MSETGNQLREYLIKHPSTTYAKFSTFSPVRPCDIEELKNAEQNLGFTLPPLLSEIYSAIANGGFGPGYGVLGINGGFMDSEGTNAVSLYKLLRRTGSEDPLWKWPEGHLLICHWGDAVYSVVDCTSAPYNVYFFDPSLRFNEPMEKGIKGKLVPLDDWMKDWMNGKDLWKEAWE